ncbi:DUF5947 family protein [Saccharopolyspora phatthalungensis]|uniref:Uncharacterized protein n=1 Tax=Saccharopolyspora phatthalungensis TaxID=664693 RepID=A0A840PZD3_9PSEU|nr:DUF5947 family protein [Saccharopolyspora phatthalungensis]MBB5152581.1 hypothetical protein [Saccharopolyspora phatthalungensis]
MSTGLRRFTTPRPESASPAGAERGCELCTEPLGTEHRHVVNIESRRILCTCRACYLLFTHPGAGGGKHRAVPERYRHLPDFGTGARIWDATEIPVGMAFLFHSSVAGPVAFYPSPAGATESLLPVQEWERALRDNPALTELQADVEALLIKQSEDGFEGFLVPIDACYRLVGIVRTHWKGFDGGTEARDRIEEFFESLRRRGERIEARDV